MLCVFLYGSVRCEPILLIIIESPFYGNREFRTRNRSIHDRNGTQCAFEFFACICGLNKRIPVHLLHSFAHVPLHVGRPFVRLVVGERERGILCSMYVVNLDPLYGVDGLTPKRMSLDHESWFDKKFLTDRKILNCWLSALFIRINCLKNPYWQYSMSSAHLFLLPPIKKN